MSESTMLNQKRVLEQRWLSVALALTWCVLGVPLVIGAARRLWALMFYPYPADGLEGTLLSQAHVLWSGQPLYQPFELYRFVSAPYPPWHPLALGFADQFAGPHPFWSGRMVSLLAALGVVIALALAVRVASRSWGAGLVMAAFLLSTPPVILWATRIKPDMYALLWTALGLLFALWATTYKHRRSLLVASALCFALAFFSKQTALAGPLAVGVALLAGDVVAWRNSGQSNMWQLLLRARTLLFSLVYLGLVGAAWIALDWWSNGQFTFHIWTQHRNALWTPQLMWKFVALLGTYWPLMVAAVAVLWLAQRSEHARIAACYLAAAPLTLYGAGKTGANHNHLLETLLALSLCGGMVLGWGLHALERRNMAAWAAVALIALQLVLAYRPPEWYRGELFQTGNPQRYLDFIRTVPGEVLADNPSWLYMVGKPLRYDDPSGFGPVAFSGLWDQRGLVDDIANKRFDAILISIDVEVEAIDPARRWTPDMLHAIRDHYQILFADSTFVYVPRP